jgi:hypothetical protein
MRLILTLTLWMLIGPGAELLVDMGDPIKGSLVYAHVVVTCYRYGGRQCQVIRFVRGESKKLRYTVTPTDLRRGWKNIIRLVPPGCDRHS